MENKKISQLDPYSGSPDSFDIPGVADGQTLKTNLGAAIQQKITSQRLLSPSDLKTVNGVPITGPGDLALDVANPFKGRFPAGTTETENLPTGEGVPRVGDYAYVDTVDGNDEPVLKVYDCVVDGTWHDSGRTADPANVNTFADGQQLGLVHINPDLDTGGHDNVPSAEAVKGLQTRLYGEEDTESEAAVALPSSTTFSKGFRNGTAESDTVYFPAGTVRGGVVNLTPYREQGFTKIRVTVAQGGYYGYITFLKTTALPAEEKTFAELGDVLSARHSAYNKMLVSCPASESENKVTTVDIPEDAVAVWVCYRAAADGSSAAATMRKPQSLAAAGGHRDGDIDTLRRLAEEQAARPVPAVADTLESDDPAAALSAAQGKRLADLTLQTVEPENLLDPASVKTGYYVRKDNGAEATGLSAVYGCTGFFEIPPEGICCDNVIAMQGTNGIPAVIYNESKTRVATAGTAAGRVAVNPAGHDDWRYVRFNIAGGDTGVYRGLTPPPYTPWFAPYLRMKDGTVADGAVTMAKLAFAKTVTGKNLLDPATIQAGSAVRHTDGRVVNASKYGATGLIPVSPRGLVLNHAPSSPGSIGMGLAVYGPDGAYLRGKAADGPTAVYTYRDGDAYVRFTANTAWSQLQVEEGAEPTAYEPYEERLVIDPAVLPGTGSAAETHHHYADGVEVVLPPEILVTQGDSLQLFYRPMVKAVNPYAFDILAVCKSGKFYPRYLQLDTAYASGGAVAYLAAGTRALTVSVSVSSSVAVAEGGSTIRVIPVPSSPASPVNILLVGASRIEGGAISKELHRRLAGTDGVDISAATLSSRSCFANPKGLGLTNVNFVGRQANDGARQDGRSGRHIKDIATAATNIYTFRFTPGGQVLNQGDVYSQGTLRFTVRGSNADAGDLECTLDSGSGSPAAAGTLTLVSGSGSDSLDYTSVDIDNSNPFWNADPAAYGGEVGVSFRRYADIYCDGAPVDIFILHLCDNDIFNQPNTATIAGYVRTLLRAYHRDYPSGKFIIATSCLPDLGGGMGASYAGNADNTYWARARQYWAYCKAVYSLAAEEEFASFSILATSFVEFDAENLYYYHNVATSNRSAVTERLGYNGLHFGAPGQKTIADSLFHAVCHALNQINNPAS